MVLFVNLWINLSLKLYLIEGTNKQKTAIKLPLRDEECSEFCWLFYNIEDCEISHLRLFSFVHYSFIKFVFMHSVTCSIPSIVDCLNVIEMDSDFFFSFLLIHWAHQLMIIALMKFMTQRHTTRNKLQKNENKKLIVIFQINFMQITKFTIQTAKYCIDSQHLIRNILIWAGRTKLNWLTQNNVFESCCVQTIQRNKCDKFEDMQIVTTTTQTASMKLISQ